MDSEKIDKAVAMLLASHVRQIFEVVDHVRNLLDIHIISGEALAVGIIIAVHNCETAEDAGRDLRLMLETLVKEQENSDGSTSS